MEGRSKSLIIRSPRMDGLKYFVANMAGVLILVVPKTLELDKLDLEAALHQKPGKNQEPEISPIDLDRLLEIIEKAGVIGKESTK